MEINSALILCAGFGKRLNPLTLKTPKPLLTLKNKTILEKCISIIIKLGIKKIYLNTFYLGEQISNFIKDKTFPIDIQIIDDGKKYAIFGEGGVRKTAEEFKKDFLGEIPIDPEVGKQGDIGSPIVESKPDHKISKVFNEIAGIIMQDIA